MADTPQKPAQQLRELAQTIRNDPTARESIAQGFELIATAMEPCTDCSAPLPVGLGDDAPDVGQDGGGA